MRKVIACEFLSLDGVAQAPGQADEDPGGGFRHGGWHMRYLDDAAQASIVEDLHRAGGFLLGRHTYDIFAGYWPNAGDEQRVVAEPLNTKPKYVASTTLAEPLGWENSTLLRGDVPAAVAALREQDGDDLYVIGSTGLVRTLVRHDLVDGLRLMIDPLLLGGGKRVFPDDGVLRSLELVEHQVTSTGAILATYTRLRT